VSSSSEPEQIRRPLQYAGVVALLAVQLGVASMLLNVRRLALAPTNLQIEPSDPHAMPVATPTVWRASVVGSIDAFGDDWFVLMGQERRVRVHIGPSTTVTTRKAPAHYADLHIGATVIVSGERRPDGALLAHTVVLASPRESH
jgi:hypothetical protein